MKILVHRSVRDGDQYICGIRTFDVPECWSANMGLIIDEGGDPYEPREFSAFVNARGVVVVDMSDSYTPDESETLEHCAAVWLPESEGWRLVPHARSHYELTPREVADLPPRHVINLEE